MKNAGCGETHPPPGSATSKRRGRSQVFCQSPLEEARAKWKTRAAGKPTPHQGPPPQSGVGEARFFAKALLEKRERSGKRGPQGNPPPPGSAASKRRGRSQVFCQSPLGEARAKWKTRAAGKPTPTRVRRLKAACAKISSLPSFLTRKREKGRNSNG